MIAIIFLLVLVGLTIVLSLMGAGPGNVLSTARMSTGTLGPHSLLQDRQSHSQKPRAIWTCVSLPITPLPESKHRADEFEAALRPGRLTATERGLPS